VRQTATVKGNHCTVLLSNKTAAMRWCRVLKQKQQQIAYAQPVQAERSVPRPVDSAKAAINTHLAQSEP